jgi:D-alanyl-D-alanine carboxypeptidase
VNRPPTCDPGTNTVLLKRFLAPGVLFALVAILSACGSTAGNPTGTEPESTLTPRPPTRSATAEDTETPDTTPDETETGSPTDEPTSTETDEPEPTETEPPEDTPTGDPNVTPTGTSEDCNGPDPNADDLHDPQLPKDDVLRLTDKHTVSLGSYYPSDLVQLTAAYTIKEDESGSLRRAAANAVMELIDAAAADGIELKLVSGFRSCPTQVVVFNSHVQQLGLAEAERQSARPGHSEHQLGLAADISAPSVGFNLDQALGETDEGRWLNRNAEKFGFVLSYPQGAESITGYFYEPWHWRFVGSRANARAFNNSGMYLNQWLLTQGN